MFNRRLILSFFLIFLIGASIVKPTFAMDKNFLYKDKTVLPSNERVDNVIILGHNIDIKGKVDISAIVINGNMKISKTARINGIVLVINGNVVQEQGSYVKENILAFKFKDETLNHLLIAAALLLGNWLIHFVLSILLVLLSVLIGLFLGDKGEYSGDRIKKESGRLILTGAIASLILVGIILLLIFTVIGIPIAIILSIPPIIFFLIGLSLLSRMVGEKLLSNLNPAKWVISLTGSFVLVSIFNFPFFGWIVFLCIFWLSSGLLLIWVKTKWFRKR
ncbi:MAG: hypothetical protein Q8934_06980 [Bacillota bacterium]|nr:hypothetical protein [Bacillota bacterium]